jgi:PAS domain S-box-containing protein
MSSTRFWRRNLTVRLVCSFLLLSLMIVSLLGLIVYYQASQSITGSVYTRLDAVTKLKEDSLNNWVDDQTQNVVMIAGVPGIRRQSAILLGSPDGSVERESAYAELSSFLPEMIIRSVYMEEIFIIDLNGTVVVSSDRMHEGQSVASDLSFTEGRSKTLATPVYPVSPDEKPFIVIVTPLFDMQGKRTGVLASYISLTHVDRIILERTGLGRSGETYLVDRNRRVVSETPLMENGTSSRMVMSEGIDAALGGNDGSGLYRNYAGIPVIGVYHWVDNQNVALLTEMSQDEAFAPARDLALSILYIGILLSVILAAGMYLLARQITRPIREIADTAARVTAGDLDRKAPVLTEDEVGHLAEAFNQMTENLGKTLQGLEENLRELKAKEDALAESEHRYRTLVENIPQKLFQKDKNLVYISCNENYASALNLRTEDIAGKTDFDLYPHEIAQKYRDDDRRVIATGTTEEFVEQYPEGGEIRWINTVKTPVRDIDGTITGIQGIFWDITDKKAAEEELRRLYAGLEKMVEERTAELKKAEEAFRRSNEKLNLLSSITRHDILNQLTALKGYLELSEISHQDPGLLRKYHDREMRIADTIQHQILFTREYQDIGVKAPAWQSLSIGLIRAKGRLDLGKVSVTLDRTDLEIYADPLFDKVFYNLIDNALAHGGEQLTTIRITTRESEEGLWITCEDNGEGISESDKKRLFERGYGKHTGLGLYLCREILQITGISITENSVPGTGARFVIHVPKGAYRIKGGA